jgi:predicted nucleic acid-binding protein
MKNTLIDAGPMIALFNSDDKYHARIMDFLKAYKGMFITTWPVITEVSYMLNYNTNVQIDFLKWINRGGVKIEEIGESDIERIMELSQKYSDIPMDLADASLIIISERSNIKDIISIDSDYNIYRTADKKMLTNIFDLQA